MQNCFKPGLQLCRSVAQLQHKPLACTAPTLFSVHSRKTHVVKTYKVQKLQNSRPIKAPDPQKMHKLADERFIYERVRYENNETQKPIEVLLLSTVEGIGIRGEIVSVSPHKARKYLLLPKFGVYASPDNIKRYAHLKNEDSVDMPSSKYAVKTVALLGGMQCVVCMNINEPWQMEPWHIRVALRKAQIIVPEYAIEMPDEPINGPNLEYQTKSFYVTITVNNREKVRVRCIIHHVSGDPQYRLPWSTMEHLKDAPAAILPSQQAYLTAMHQQRKPCTSCLEPQITPDKVAELLAKTNPTDESLL